MFCCGSRISYDTCQITKLAGSIILGGIALIVGIIGLQIPFIGNVGSALFITGGGIGMILPFVCLCVRANRTAKITPTFNPLSCNEVGPDKITIKILADNQSTISISDQEFEPLNYSFEINPEWTIETIKQKMTEEDNNNDKIVVKVQPNQPRRGYSLYCGSQRLTNETKYNTLVFPPAYPHMFRITDEEAD